MTTNHTSETLDLGPSKVCPSLPNTPSQRILTLTRGFPAVPECRIDRRPWTVQGVQGRSRSLARTSADPSPGRQLLVPPHDAREHPGPPALVVGVSVHRGRACFVAYGGSPTVMARLLRRSDEQPEAAAA